jgi:multisubunit Na+/H+ antiporter MnhF subunit
MPGSPFEKPVPGRLFVWVKRLSWVELAIFTALIVFWLVPGLDTETMVFGWAHGLGFVALCIVIWVAAVRREAPYTLLAATLTPVGPVGSVIAIRYLDRRGPSRGK